MIMELDAELKCRNKEIFAVEQGRGNLEIELAECTGVFKQKQRKNVLGWRLKRQRGVSIMKMWFGLARTTADNINMSEYKIGGKNISHIYR